MHFNQLTQCTKPVALALLVLTLTVLAALPVLTAPAAAAPRRPVADNEVLEKLPLRAGDTSLRELSSLRAAVTQSPTDPQATTRLAQAYFDLAIARGDPRYVGYAQAVVSGFAGPLPAPLLVMRGMLGQYRHGFDDALQDFSAALELDPELAIAHSWRAAIYLVQADYKSAQKECKNLQRLGRHSLWGACMGLAQAYGGQLQTGYQTLQDGMGRDTYQDNRLWFLTRLGEVAAWRGQMALAERHFKEALQLGQDDGYLLAAWSDFLLDNARPVEVIQLLSNWEASDSLLLRLAQAEVALNLPAAARHLQTLDDRFSAAKLRGDTTHQAEEARYQLHLRHNAAQAVRLAADNYRVQREPRDARILLEAAIAARTPAAAQPVRDWLRSSGFEDVRLQKLGQASATVQP